MSSLKEQFRAAMAPPSAEVTVEGVTFRMVGLGAADHMKLAQMAENQDSTFWILERMIRDENGVRVFEDDDPAIRDFAPKALAALTEQAVQLLGLEQTVKN